MNQDPDQRDNRLTPDPTVLTTEAQGRAIESLRDYVDGQLEVLRERFRGIDRATEVLNETVNRVPTDVQEAVGHARQIMDERSAGFETRFALIEGQRVEQKADTKAAVDAALAAAKEAVKEQTTAFGLATTKSETSQLEQMKQLQVTFTTAVNGLTAALGDLKTRVERIEGRTQGGEAKLSGIYAALAAAVAIIGLIVFIANGLPG